MPEKSNTLTNLAHPVCSEMLARAWRYDPPSLPRRARSGAAPRRSVMHVVMHISPALHKKTKVTPRSLVCTLLCYQLCSHIVSLVTHSSASSSSSVDVFRHLGRRRSGGGGGADGRARGRRGGGHAPKCPRAGVGAAGGRGAQSQGRGADQVALEPLLLPVDHDHHLEAGGARVGVRARGRG